MPVALLEDCDRNQFPGRCHPRSLRGHVSQKVEEIRNALKTRTWHIQRHKLHFKGDQTKDGKTGIFPSKCTVLSTHFQVHVAAGAESVRPAAWQTRLRKLFSDRSYEFNPVSCAPSVLAKRVISPAFVLFAGNWIMLARATAGYRPLCAKSGINEIGTLLRIFSRFVN